MNDYYQTLGVGRDASPDDIKKAYRKMAAKHHPDRGGTTEEFQKIEEAYRNLSDPNLKAQHDNPNPFGGQQGFPGGGFPGGFSFNFGGGNPFDDIFAQFTRQHRQQQRVYSAAMWVTLEQVFAGSESEVAFNTPQGHKVFKIKVPQGVEDGAQVRYSNLMPDGDLQIEFRIQRHHLFERQALELRMPLKVSVFDLITGTTVMVPTIEGTEVEVTIPPRTQPGTILRLQGRGLIANGERGSQFLLITATIPDTISDSLLELILQERSKTK